jgi:hypothetical protein
MTAYAGRTTVKLLELRALPPLLIMNNFNQNPMVEVLFQSLRHATLYSLFHCRVF